MPPALRADPHLSLWGGDGRLVGLGVTSRSLQSPTVQLAPAPGANPGAGAGVWSRNAGTCSPLQGRCWGAGQRLMLTRCVSKPRAPGCELHAPTGRARRELGGSAGTVTRLLGHRGQPEGGPGRTEREGSCPPWAEGLGGHS